MLPKNWKHITSDGVLELMDALDEDTGAHRLNAESRLRNCCGPYGYVDLTAFRKVCSDMLDIHENAINLRKWLEYKWLVIRFSELARENREQEKKAHAKQETETSAASPKPKPCTDESCEICRAMERRREMDTQN